MTRRIALLAACAAIFVWTGGVASALVPVPEHRPATTTIGIEQTPPVPAHRPARVGILTTKDHAALRTAIDAASRGAWALARQAAASAKEPLLADYIDWLYHRGVAARHDLDALLAFIAKHPEWPEQDRLHTNVELAFDETTPHERVLDWFDKRTPRTANGRLRLAEALLATGRAEAGRKLLRRTWVEDVHSIATQSKILRAHGRLLTEADHIARLDNLLWNGQRASANRMLRLVPAGHRKLTQARIALRQSAGNVDTLIARVPKALQGDAGLIYERVRWRRLKGKDDGAVELLLKPPADLGPAPEKWWTEQHIQVRNALNDGDLSLAYRLAASSRQPPGSLAHAEAEFLAGWIALRFLHDPDAAYRHFGRLYHAVQYPVSLARAAYWSARAAAELQQFDLAERWLRIAADHPATYYGQLATERLRERGLRFPAPPKPTRQELAAFEAHPMVRLARILREAGEQDWLLRIVLLDLHDRANSSVGRWLVGRLAIDLDRPDLAVRAGKSAIQGGDLLVDVAYPRLSVGLDGVEDALILAVGRQESEFNLRAVSSAGARGLMQLMPATAKAVAGRLQVSYRPDALLSDPIYNTRLGGEYLRGLVQDYNGSLVLAVAAYNAGPSRVSRWIKDFGDPRQPDVDVIDWIELIPFGETRNYVQRVMENLQVYRHLLGERPERTLLADLNSHERPGQAVGCDKC